MRLPSIFRTTPFRLTLLFLALFAGAASAFLAYIYGVTALEVTRIADASITREVQSLEGAYGIGGREGLKRAMVERTQGDRPFLYLLQDPSGHRLWGTLPHGSIARFDDRNTDMVRFSVTRPGLNGGVNRELARGMRQKLTGGETLFVGQDVTEAEAYVFRIDRALGMAGALVVVLGLVGGIIVSRNVNRSVAGLNAVVAAVQGGDLRARVQLRGARDEFEELAVGLNDMLDRLEHSIGGLRHAGDAIAHDLRSPLTRLRTRLEMAILDVEAGKGDPKAALAQALEDADGVLRTFVAVLAIARLQAAGSAPDQAAFDTGQLAADIAELYEPLCEERDLDFKAELSPALQARGNREFIAQALANILDNAVKYTPAGGAVMLRTRRRSSGEVEFSVTDTGPGVPDGQRERVVQRFVRLENSRNQPGAGLGLSLVAAVAEAHGGRLELDEGPGKIGEMGPGLRVALVLPRAA
ncbi:MAG TPA: HAMP domain-containing sensor histidine kinase [Caulobacteraceae bacterium]|jgi:signal transduction histidine kinase|nr:HAMP domain-containing sensor histidine kinase [Caulobacteraceae bacterium]